MKIALSIDDAGADDVKFANLLKKHGLTATFYVPVEWHSYHKLRGSEPIELQALYEISQEFEIGSHTLTHRLLTRIPFAMSEYEITQSKKDLQEIFGKEVTKFSYPRGYATDQIRDIVRKHYDHARSTLVGSIREPEDPAWEHTAVHIACQRREYGNEGWFEYGLRHLEQAKKTDGYFHAWGHSEEITRNNAWHTLDRFLEILKHEAEPA